MPYDFYINGGVSLETRRARQAGLSLQQDLNHLMSDVSINIKRDDIIQANKDILQLQQNLNTALNPTRGTVDLSMLNTQLNKTGSSLAGYANSLTKYGKEGQQAFLSLTKTIAAAEAPTSRLSQGLKDAGEQLKRTVGWQLSSSAIHGVMSTYSQAISYAKELNRSLTDIRIVTGQSQAQMANFAKNANIAAKGLSSTTTRYTDAALIYYQQGLSDKAVKDRTNVTIKMANVAGVSAEKASQQLTAIWNNFDNGSKSLEHYADVLVKLGSETASSTDEISKGVQKFAAIGNTVGLSYEYAASALATVTATTRESADTVGTSFRTLFSRLQGLSLGNTLEDGTTLNKYSKALNTIGVRIKETNGDMRKMNDILDDIGSKWDTLNKDTQIGLAQSIGGARQYTTFMALMDNWDYFQENLDRANNATGALQKQQDIYAESWAAASNRVRTSMEGIFDSVIEDKSIIKMTNAFAGALDIVNGLTNGLGGLSGIMHSVGGIMISRYSKELPRIAEELAYNYNYIFNPKKIERKQDATIQDAINGIDSLREQAGIIKNDSTGAWISSDGNNIALAAELDNQEKQLLRRKEYLKVEKTLSQKEKEEYQQRMQQAQMWDNHVLAYANQTQNAYDELKIIKESVAEEAFMNMKDIRSTRIQSFKGQQYDFKNDNQVIQYQNARMQAIDNEYNRRLNLINQQQNTQTRTMETQALDGWRRQQTNQLNREVSSFRMQAQADYEAFDNSLKNSTNYLTTAFANQKQDGVQVTPDAFKQAMYDFQKTGQIDYSQRQILDKGFQLIQEPLIETGKSLGHLDGITNRLVRTITNTNEAELKGISIQEKINKTGIGSQTFSDDLKTAWKTFTDAAQKNEISLTDPVMKTANEAYTKLNQALTGVDAKGNKTVVTKDQLTKLVKNFQASYNDAIGKIDRKAWESGLTPDQTKDIIAKAKAAGISEDAQKDIEYRRQQEQFERIQHQTSTMEVYAKAGTAAMMAVSTLNAGSNLYQTWNDPNATGLQKNTAALGTFASSAMLAGSLTTLGGAMASGGSGLIATIGTALANPMVAIIGAAITAAIPVVTGIVDEYIETDEEKQERLKAEVITTQEDKDKAIQKANNFTSIANEYQSNLTKAKLSEKGTHDATSNTIKSNESAYAIIDQYDLSSDDYIRDSETGLIEIKEDTLNDIQKTLDDEAIAAQNRSRAINFASNFISQDQIDEAYEEATQKQKKLNQEINKGAFSQYYTKNEDGTKTYYSRNDENIEAARNASEEAWADYKILKEQQPLENQEKYYDVLSEIAASDGKLTDSEKNAIQYLQSHFDTEKEQEIIDQIEEEYGGNEYAYSLSERKQKAKDVFGEDRYNQIIKSEEYKSLETEAEKNQYLARLTKGEALTQEYQQQIQNTEKLFDGLNANYKNITDKDSKEFKNYLTQLNQEITSIKADGISDDEQAKLAQLELAYNYAESYGNRVTTDLVNVIKNYTDVGARDANGYLMFQDWELKQQENLANIMQDFGDTFGKNAAESIYRAALNADGASRDNLINTLKSVDLTGSKINSLYNVKQVEKQLGKDFKDIFSGIKEAIGGDSGIFAELTKDNTIKKLIANFQELGDIDASAIAKAMNSSTELSQAFEVANFNAGGLARSLESVAAGYVTQQEVTDAFLASMSVLGEGDTVKSDMWNFIDNYDAGRSVSDSTKFFRSVSKTLYTGINQGLYGDDPFQNAWEAMYGRDSLNTLNQDLHDWEYAGLNVTEEFKKKYKAEFDEIRTMSKSKTKNNAPIAKTAFEEESLDKDQQFVEGTTSTYHSDYTQDDLKWANDIINGTIEGSDRDKADAQRILDNYKAEDPGTVAIDGAMYDKNEVKFNEEKGQWETGFYDEEGNWQADEKFDEQKALYGYNSRTGQIETPKDFNRSREEMKKDLMANLGMTEIKANAILADMYTQDQNLRQIWDGQERAAIEQKDAEGNIISRDWSQLGSLGTLATESVKNGEFITRGQLEAQYAQNENLLRDMGYGDMDRWINEVGSSGVLGDRYLDFGDLNPQTASLDELNNALKTNTGSDTTIQDRVEASGTYVRMDSDYLEAQKLINSYEDARALGLGTQGFTAENNALIAKYGDIDGLKAYYAEATQNIEKGDAYDLTGSMEQLAAMGLGEDASYEALTKIMQEQNAILTGGFTDANGTFKQMSSDNAEYQKWAEDNGGVTAETFANYLTEQQQIEAKIREIAIQEQAMAEYQKRTAEATEENNASNTEEKEEQSTDTQEEEATTTKGKGKGNNEEETGEEEAESAITDAEEPPPPPPSSGGEEETSSGGGSTKKQETVTVITPRDDGSYVISTEVVQEETPAKAIGQNQYKIKQKYAKGRKSTDDYEGIAQVGELGPELSIDKDGNATMLGADGPTYAYVKKDDIIFTADETEDILKTNPNLNNIPGFWGGYNNDNLGGTTYGDIGGGGNVSRSGSGGGEDDDWEPDRYVVILEQLQDLQREYARLAKAKERAYGADRIKAIDKEIGKTKELIEAQKEYISEIEQYLEKDIQKMKDLGIDVEKEFQFDANGVIRNFDEIEEKYKKAAEEGDEAAAKKFEAIQQYIETNNLLQEQADALIDLQWQLLDAQLERITTKVDIKLAVDDTELQYLEYLLSKINEEAYDVAKAIDLIGKEMSTTMNKTGTLRVGIREALTLALEGVDFTTSDETEGLTEDEIEDLKKEKTSAVVEDLIPKIMEGTLTQDDLDKLKLDENISQAVMEVVLSYRDQLLQINQSLDQLRRQMVQMVETHFNFYEDKMGQQTAMLNAYSKSLNSYYDLVTLLDGKFNGPINEMLDNINDNLAKQAKDGIKHAEMAVKTAEAKYMEYMELYNTAIAMGDQDTAEQWKAAMESAAVEVEQSYAELDSAILSANEEFLRLFKEGIARAIEDFDSKISGLYGSVENMSAAFERQNNLSKQYVDDYKKYYELNRMARDLQTSIDETDNINSKKALMKLQDEINKKKTSENKLSEYDLETLQNKIELEKARLALDEAKNAKSTVTLSRDQNGNWGYVYTAEEDKVAEAEQEYDDKLYQYQESNKKYIDDLQAMLVEAKVNMRNAIADLDPNDPYFKQNQQNIIDSYLQTVSYIQEQMQSALGNQDSTLDLSLDRYSVSSMNLKTSFDELNISIVTGQKNLENYFTTLQDEVPKLLAKLQELENVYDERVADALSSRLTNGKTLEEYLNENIDGLNKKSEAAMQNMDNIYGEMVSKLEDINKEIGEIYINYIKDINDMIEKNEQLAESIQAVQKELSDLTGLEDPPDTTGTIWDNPEGYTENEWGVIRNLTDDEKKKLKEIKDLINIDEKGYITNYEELKNKWYQEAPADGEEDKRDKEKMAYWELLQNLISWNGYKIGSGRSAINAASINSIVDSNANANFMLTQHAVAAELSKFKHSFEQKVNITAEFPNATNRFEIQEAFNNIVNEAAQYAYRRS